MSKLLELIRNQIYKQINIYRLQILQLGLLQLVVSLYLYTGVEIIFCLCIVCQQLLIIFFILFEQ